jgi:hypothetical protein
MAESPSKKAKTSEEKQKLNVVICGGGNSTHVLAALAANAGHVVTILTRRPEDWSKTVKCENQDPGWLKDAENTITGEVSVITSEAATCIPTADVIVLGGIPVHLYRSVLKQVCPHITRTGVLIGSLCAYGGFSWLVAEAMGVEKVKTVCVFGTQSIPWTCGTLKYGSEGVVFGAKRHLHIALENDETSSAILQDSALDTLQGLLRNEIVSRTDFLVCTLWPNNPLFHPTVLYGIFSDWDMKTPYKVEDVPARIYADVTKRSADYIQKMDDELQLISEAVRAKTPGWDEERLCRPLKECLIFHYQELIGDTTDLFTILRTNKGYAKHRITYAPAGEGLVIPDVTHKFFTTDLPFGLIIYKDLALMLGIDIPIMDELIYWNQKMVDKEFLTKEGTLTGKDIDEAVLPSKFGLKF